MQRYIHTFLRFFVLLIIPLIVGPVMATQILLSITTYTATASLWVETSAYSDVQQPSVGSSYTSPAKQFGDQLTELLSTRNFKSSLLDNTQLTNPPKTETDRLSFMDDLSKNIKIDATGWSLIKLSYSDKSAQSAYSIISSTVSSFIGYYSSIIGQQANNAITYYQGLVNTSKSDLDKATKALEDFLAANPNKVGSEGAAKAVTQEDIQYGLLTQNRDAARKVYDTAVANLDKTKNSLGALQQGQGTTLTIKDQPQVADNQTSKVRQIALGIGIGLVVGGLIAGLITVLLTLLDNKFRIASRTQQVLGVRRVMVLPDRRMTKKGRYKSMPPLVLALASPAANVATVNFPTVRGTKKDSNKMLTATVEKDFLPKYKPIRPAVPNLVRNGLEKDKAENSLEAVSQISKPASRDESHAPVVKQNEVKVGLGLVIRGLKTALLTTFHNIGKLRFVNKPPFKVVSEVSRKQAK